jgi:hypothetical protein
MNTLSAEEIERVVLEAPVIADALKSLLRRDEKRFEAILNTVILNDSISKTKAQFNCHFIALDGTQRPRVNALIDVLRNHIVEYCIPQAEIKAAEEYLKNHKSVAKFTELDRKAQTLFTSLANTGEGGEILVYLLTEHFLKCPQLLCKMSLKTSGQLHFNGSDGIHAGVDPKTNKLLLYWAEAKMYASLSKAIDAGLKSLAPFLLDQGGVGSAQERDLALLRDNLRINNAELEKALLQYLNPQDLNFKKLEFRGVCLIGYNYANYPTAPNEKTEETIRNEISGTLEELKTNLGSAILKYGIEGFVFDVFCLPFPDVESFRHGFLKSLGKVK